VPRCPSCAGAVERRHRFCPWCAAPLRHKLVELFRPHPAIDGDASRALRVSRYLDGEVKHTRFSIWDVDHARSAISLDDAEAARLAAFLSDRPAVEAADTQPMPVSGP
jgi:hypothetical protein